MNPEIYIYHIRKSYIYIHLKLSSDVQIILSFLILIIIHIIIQLRLLSDPNVISSFPIFRTLSIAIGSFFFPSFLSVFPPPIQLLSMNLCRSSLCGMDRIDDMPVMSLSSAYTYTHILERVLDVLRDRAKRIRITARSIRLDAYLAYKEKESLTEQEREVQGKGREEVLHTRAHRRGAW